MMDKEELSRRYQEGKKILMRIPGVLGVGFGSKEIAGTTTDTTAFRVYVKQKRSPDELTSEEQIPTQCQGFPTDVIKVAKCVPDHCQDLGDHDKVVGGISISNLLDFLDAYRTQTNRDVEYVFGSIACVATIDNNDDLNKYAFITNRHVIDVQRAEEGNTIYNPKVRLNAAEKPVVKLTSENRPVSLNSIGSILDKGIYDNYPYEHPGEDKRPYFIDCAAIKIDTCISSWCKTNCGTNFKNEIKGLNVNNGNDITGIKHITEADEQTPVFKVGRTTGRTVGKIVDFNGVAEFPEYAGEGICENIIIVEITEPNCNGEMKFSDSGDSGTAYVNGNREIIGVHFGHSADDRKQSFAGCIYPIMHKLKVTPITSNNTDQAQSASQEAPRLLTPQQGSNAHFEQLKLTLQQVPAGRSLLQLVETHRAEVTGMVNHTRVVTVAWHRHKGPAFLQHCLQSSRHPDHYLPQEIDGISFAQLLDAMILVLKAEGSYDLGQAIALHEMNLRISVADNFRLEDVLSRFIQLHQNNSITINPQ